MQYGYNSANSHKIYTQTHLVREGNVLFMVDFSTEIFFLKKNNVQIYHNTINDLN